MSAPGGGGSPAGIDTAQLASMQQAQQSQGAGGKTGYHELIFGRVKPDHGWKPQQMGTFTGNLIPKNPGMPAPGGGIRSRSKPLKKENYRPAPGGEKAGGGGSGAHHIDPKFSGHVNPQFKHLEVMGVGGWQSHPAFMGLDPILGGRSPFQGMSLYAGRMSPHAMMNFSPVTQVFGQGSSTGAAFQAHAGAMAAQQAAKGAGRTA